MHILSAVLIGAGLRIESKKGSNPGRAISKTDQDVVIGELIEIFFACTPLKSAVKLELALLQVAENARSDQFEDRTTLEKAHASNYSI